MASTATPRTTRIHMPRHIPTILEISNVRDGSHPVALIDFAISDMIKLFIGPTRELVRVHKAILCDRSRFFQACLETGFLESRTNEIHLPEEEITAFSFMVTWLYTNDIHQAVIRSVGNGFIVLLYKMADRLMLVDFKNLIMDKFRSVSYILYRFASPIMLLFMYEEEMTEMPLYRFCVDSLAHRLVAHQDDFRPGRRVYRQLDALEEYAELDSVVAYRMADCSGTSVNPAESIGCQYHEHEEGQTCGSGIQY